MNDILILQAKIDLALESLNFDSWEMIDEARTDDIIKHIELAKQHLRCHDQAALNAVKAVAVLDFVNHIIGAYEAGFVDTPTLTLFDLYQTARNHVKDGYITITPGCHEVWGEELAEELKGSEA